MLVITILRYALDHEQDLLMLLGAIAVGLVAPVALITGAAGGIGAALAAVLARRGHRLTLVDVDGDRLAAVTEPLVAAGSSVQSMVVDVADAAMVADAFDAATARWGHVDLVLPFAALFVEPHQSVTPQLREHLYDVNLRHPLQLADLALARAARLGRPCTAVMPLSDAGLRADDPWIYARAKAELHARARILRKTWRRHPEARVLNAVVYPTLTEFAANSDQLMQRAGLHADAVVDHAALETLLARGAHPAHVAEVILAAAADGRRAVYLDPHGASSRRRAWLRGEVLEPLSDCMPRRVHEALGRLPRLPTGQGSPTGACTS